MCGVWCVKMQKLKDDVREKDTDARTYVWCMRGVGENMLCGDHHKKMLCGGWFSVCVENIYSIFRMRF